MSDELRDFAWLYRGVPYESEQHEDVRAIGEVRPPRPERVGESWIQRHQAGFTQTGYTSWSTNRSLAEDAALAATEDHALSGRIVILRVRVRTLPTGIAFMGREDEDEYLIQGTVEGVSISRSEFEDEEEVNEDAD